MFCNIGSISVSFQTPKSHRFRRMTKFCQTLGF
jgi:hypothetical protein